MNEIKSSSLKFLSNEVLLQKTLALVAEERKLATSVLWHLYEIQRRRLYSEKGYASLFEYAVQALGYSEAAAGRRISAMRLLIEVPEIEPALKNGQVSLSTLCTIQHFFQRKEEPVSKQEKKELVFALQGKSRRECEKELAALDPKAIVPQERERTITPTQTEIRFVADDELMQKFKKIRELDGHVSTGASYLELFHRVADLALRKLDPLNLKKTQTRSSSADDRSSISVITQTPASAANSTPPAEPRKENVHQNQKLGLIQKNPRFISAPLRRAIWTRDQSCCQYISPDGRRCTSRFALEIDHKTPVVWGGKSQLSNLQLLCRDHNRQKAVAQIGGSVMQRYLR